MYSNAELWPKSSHEMEVGSPTLPANNALEQKIRDQPAHPYQSEIDVPNHTQTGNATTQ